MEGVWFSSSAGVSGLGSHSPIERERGRKRDGEELGHGSLALCVFPQVREGARPSFRCCRFGCSAVISKPIDKEQRGRVLLGLMGRKRERDVMGKGIEAHPVSCSSSSSIILYFLDIDSSNGA